MLTSRSIPTTSMFEEFDSFFRNIFQNEPRPSSVTSEALYATDNGWAFRAELPGFSKNNLNVKVDQGILTIKALIEKENRNYEKKLKLNSKIDPSKITASLKDGLLEVALPKQKEGSNQPLNIEIK